MRDDDNEKSAFRFPSSGLRAVGRMDGEGTMAKGQWPRGNGPAGQDPSLRPLNRRLRGRGLRKSNSVKKFTHPNPFHPSFSRSIHAPNVHIRSSHAERKVQVRGKRK